MVFFIFVIFKFLIKFILKNFLKIEIVMWKKLKIRLLKWLSGMWGLLRKYMEFELYVIFCNYKFELFCIYLNIKIIKCRLKLN